MCGGINVIIHCFNKKCKLNHQVFLAKWYAHTFRKPYNVIKFCDTAVGCSQSSPWKLQYLSFCIHRQLHVVGKKEFFKFFPLSHYPKHIFITVEPIYLPSVNSSYSNFRYKFRTFELSVYVNQNCYFITTDEYDPLPSVWN